MFFSGGHVGGPSKISVCHGSPSALPPNDDEAHVWGQTNKETKSTRKFKEYSGSSLNQTNTSEALLIAKQNRKFIDVDLVVSFKWTCATICRIPSRPCNGLAVVRVLRKITRLKVMSTVPTAPTTRGGGATGQLFTPKFSKTCLIVKYNYKLQ